MENSMEVPQKITEVTYDPAITFLGIYLDKTFIEKDTCTCFVHGSTIHNSQDMETTQMSVDR